ncbi:MAG: (Fe-S)-binding protein [Deltaproteobacteria bacterium]|jgi:glycolate oxidase iron-sulfur subunit|nr:(Fe-S)-binding protein [Deltaproteobacteria bacterium]
MSNEYSPSSLTELAKMLMQLDDLLVSCMRCGFCQSVCPVYGATFREADVTRGKIALLEDLAHELTADAENVNERLNRCLLCGSCETNCPSGVNIMDIYLRARAIVAGYKGLGTIKKLVFRFILPKPGLFNFLVKISSVFQKPFLKRANQKVGTSTAAVLNPFLGRRHIPSLPGKTFASANGSVMEPGRGGPMVALFPGCVPDKVFPGLAEASLKILRHHGAGIFCPTDELVCCGIPVLASGDVAAFDELTKRNLEALKKRPFDYLVTPCATCASNIKENWHRFKDRFSAEHQSLIEKIHSQTMDLTAFLVKVLKVDFQPSQNEGKIVTYHDPCHLKKSLGVSAEPRAILKSLPGLSFKEMPMADSCCGFGGSFSLFHYDLSKQIGQSKRDNIVKVSPEVVATSCPACMMQLMDIMSQNNDQVEVKHVAELYADTLN